DPGTATGFSVSKDDQLGSAATPLDAELGPLQDNGGSTPTHYPLIDGPVIDAGNNAWAGVVDQRGIERPQDGDDNGQATSDIGAVEFILFTEIHGTKFHDRNSNGVQDAGEEPLVDWTIFLDTNDDGELDAGETNTTTDADGNYSFVGLSPGSYIVREVGQTGWEQVSPEPRITEYVIAPTMRIGDASMVEPDSGTGELELEITLTHPSLETITVEFATADGTAAAGTDYEAVSSTLSFEPGVTSQTITVTVNDDPDHEATETFVGTLSNVVGATLGDSQATATIYDRDAAFVVNSTADAVDANPGDGVAEDSQGRTTLRAAIMEANATAGDDSIFVPAGTYTLTIGGSGEDGAATGDLDITDTSGHLTITGAGADVVTIDANDLDRVIDIHAEATADISFLTLTNGKTLGPEDGGGLRVTDVHQIGGPPVQVVLNGLQVRNNISSTFGGGIYISGASIVTITGSTIANNTANGGAGIAVGSDSSESPESVVTIRNTLVSDNTAESFGGGIFNMLGGLSIFDSTIMNNHASVKGGGLRVFNRLELFNSEISGNDAYYGGGISVYGTEGGERVITISRSSLTANSSVGYGGGLFVAGGYRPVITIESSTISGNVAEGGATPDGSGLFIESANYDAGRLRIANSTITDNYSSRDGGGMYIPNTLPTSISNSIIAGNSADGQGNDLVGTFGSGGYNLIGDIGSAVGFTDGIDGDQVGTSESPIDAKLEPLADNGGPTLTHRPLLLSPIIDAGDPFIVDRIDQRGVSGVSNGGGVDTFVVDLDREHVITTNANRAQSVFAADVDADGDMDVLSASSADDKIAWYENNGNGNFTTHVITTNADAAQSVFAADVDADGDMDVLSASEGHAKIAWYDNDGSQNFTERVISASAVWANSVFAADVDADGDMDVLSASEHDDKIAWYENDGIESFTTHVITTNADGAQSVFAADVDADGDMDVLSASKNDNQIAWYENDGNEIFTTHVITTNANSANSVFAADVDADGDMDVLSASALKIAWYENDGNESFATRVITTNAEGARSVFVADVDGDGDMDVLSASQSDEKIAWYENKGNGPHPETTISDSAPKPISVYAIDLDDDGDLDVLGAAQGNPSNGSITWYENDGSANFSAYTIAECNGYCRPYSVYATDVDSDGDIDVLSAYYTDDEIAWFENDGSENFTEHTITTNAVTPYSVYATDVDDDGDIDVLSASNNDDKIAWYENDGTEDFTEHTITTSADGAASVFAIDVDADGDMDVLSASYVDDKIAWYENDGNESFTSHTITGSADHVESVYAIDVDGDGDIDVLSAGRDKIIWYENDGSENFTNHTITSTAESARSVYAIDVDGDGDIDVLSASQGDDKIAWYENDGTQGFTERRITNTAVHAWSVFAGDVDGDGDIDVLSASTDDDTIAWYENTPRADIGALEQEYVHALAGSHVLTLTPGQVLTDADFANLALPGEISGTKFHDLNADGVHDGDEPGLAGWTLYLDQDGDDAYDAGEPTTVTDADGFYQFTDLPPLVDYSVGEIPQDGWSQTLPTGELTFDIQDLGTDVIYGTADFNGDGALDLVTETEIRFNNGDGEFTSSSAHGWPLDAMRSGHKWEAFATSDFDGDGDQDVAFATVEGFAVALNNGPATFVTTEYTITGSSHPRYSVLEVADFNNDGLDDVAYFSQSSPLSPHVAFNQGGGLFDPSLGGSAQWAPVFENWPPSDFDYDDDPRLVFEDVDGNGHTDILLSSDLDTNYFSVFLGDSSLPFDGEPITLIGEHPYYIATGDLNGDSRTDIVQQRYSSDSGDSTNLVVSWNQGDGPPFVSFPWVGNFFSDKDPSLGVKLYINNSSGRGVDIADIDGDGNPDIVSMSHGVAMVSDGAGGFVEQSLGLPSVGDQEVYPDDFLRDFDGNGQPDILTRSSGNHTKLALNRTSINHLVTVSPGAVITDTDFGNSLIPGEIHGTKYRDDDGDGVRDADEPGLADWTIYLDTNQNGIFNGGEPTATTNDDGAYSFTDLDPLTTYHFGEVQQLGYLQTSPVPTTGDTNVGVDPFATDAVLQTAWDITDVTTGNFFVTGLDGVGSGFNSQALFQVSADGSSVTVQTPANQPRGITADDDYLYWLDTALSGSGMGIFRRPLEGGAREQIVDGPASDPAITSARDIQFTTVDGVPTLVVSDDTAGRLFTVTLGGADAVIQQLGPDRYADTTDRQHATHIAVANGTVYLADAGQAGFGDTPVRVQSIALDGSDFTDLFVGSTDDYSLRGMAVGEGRVFLADEDEILEMPLSGATPAQLVHDPRFGDLQGLVYRDGNLYALDNTDATEVVLWQVDLESEVTVTADNMWAVDVAPGAIVTGRDFGNRDLSNTGGVGQTARIMGYWFHDIDADGVRDTGEPGLAGRTVYLDLNNNGLLESGEPSFVTMSDDLNTPATDETGLYLFTSLAPGDYTVAELEDPVDWAQSVPLEMGFALHTLSAADGPSGVATIDANGDGRPDLVATNRDSNTISVFQATADGDYLAPMQYEVGVGPTAVVTGDLDSDGVDDLVVANLYTSNVSVVRGDGSGGFHEAVHYSVGYGPFDLLVIDMDDDGDLDVATADEFSNSVSVLVNAGDGTLGTATSIDMGDSAESIVAGDWDLDGDIDLAAAVFESNEVVILTNDGSATYSVSDRHTVGTGPFSLDAGDFDGDGDNDLVAANLLSNDISLLLNGRSTGFHPQVPIAAGYAPMAISATDLDDDGDIDLAAANGTSTNLSVLLNNGSGLFAAATSYGVGDFPDLLAFSLSVTDLDGNGTRDIVLANGRDDSLAVLRNEEVPGSHRMALSDG
ncbi:FG-GAP-like repeat-containing protein, partial [Planctomycetaceae bacterium]|nr:FG-GAP-like repeat-containing protein [Planctomycetaceae bacterium]